MLLTRILSAAVLAPLVLLAVWFGGLWLAGLVVVAGGLMGWEWARLCNGGRLGTPGLFAIATLAALAPAFVFAPPTTAPAVLGIGAAIAAAVAAGSRRDAWLPLGIVYIGLACLALLWLRAVPQGGRELVFWLLAVVWATDTGAYFAGRAIGGPRLAPRISPNKTWAGLIGGALSAALVGVLAAGLVGRDAMLLVVGGMVLAVVAQGGDLLESWCKRRFGVKDSSHIIPGHGGILDRVDGLLAVLPVAFLYVWAAKESF
ncbi:MAG: phosphatidate cytidylyltransferase [Bacteroidota bacterium]|nr:phosphatidate cytidylyltransferase [Kiloniellaceae bacterium]